MKFIVNKSQIVPVLAKIQGLTGRRSNLTITENILLRSVENGFFISATDLETGFEGFYPASVEKEGSVAVSSKKIFEILREFPSDQILIQEIENRWIEISNDTIQYHIVGMNPDDFPEMVLLNEVGFFSLAASSLERMIQQTTIISPVGDEKRPHINGVYMERSHEKEKKRLRFVSTDGSRLNKSDHYYESEDEIIDDSRILIPKKGLNEVAKFLDYEGEIKVGIKESYFIVKKESETIIIRLLEGEFPKYEEILNKGEAHGINLDKVNFGKMLKRMSIMASENYKGAVFVFDDNKLVVTATNPEYGESKEETQIKYSGKNIEVAFNPKFFLDTLSVVVDDRVVLNIVDSSHPCIIEGDTDKTFVSIIMPMRI